MRIRKSRKILAFIGIMTLTLSLGDKVSASQTSQSAESLKQELESDLDQLNTRLKELNKEYNEAEKKTEEKKIQIADTMKALEKAKKAEEKKKKETEERIRNIYEAGDISYAEVLLASAGISDFMNYIEQIKDITEYDRKMMQEYRDGQTTLLQKKADLKKEQKEIEILEESVDEKKNSVSALIKSASQKLTRCEAELALLGEEEIPKDLGEGSEGDGEDAVDGGKTEPDAGKVTADSIAKELIVKAQKKSAEQIDKELAEQGMVKAEAERVKAEGQKSDPDIFNTNNNAAGQWGSDAPTSTSSPAIAATADDLQLLACIIEAEAGNQSEEGKVAVGNVVLNRVRSSEFPNTIYGVIYQSGQFTPVDNGSMAITLAKGAESSCVDAAQKALSGVNYVGDALFFRTNNGRPGQVIGAHVFY